MGKLELIGISSSSAYTRNQIAHAISGMGFEQCKFDDVIMNFMCQILGIDMPSLENPEVFSAYLGREWSYVVHENFQENGKTVTKPVRYYLSPKHIFKRLKYDLRAIHSDFWVNAYFNSIRHHLQRNRVFEIQYPNQADAILERGGIVVRFDNMKNNSPITKEESIMNDYSRFTEVFQFSSAVELSQAIDKLNKKYIHATATR